VRIAAAIAKRLAAAQTADSVAKAKLAEDISAR